MYEYDNNGRRIGAVESGRVMTYTYDALYRLTDAVESTGDVYHYEYDAAGNRLLKVEPGVNQAATYDAANQLLSFDGAAVQHDDNGNLVHDGVFSYSYNSLDQLISVSDGSSGTLYGYNGDGDRLWQNSDGISTTFLLDLNGALAQVLAQTPHTTGAATTYFVPGTAGQQTLSAWSYLHSDGLGSVRHLSDASGQVLGNLRYSPFGQLVEMSGPSPMFGFSGEQQDFANNLVYLRARHYNPALGRFLTPDSLIPDVTNGQSLNAYAYVTNDPLNLVDPSGNIPDVGSAIVSVAKHLPTSWQSRIHGGAAVGLGGLNWWYSQPDDCSCQNGGDPAFWGPVIGVGAQGANGIATKPADMYGTMVAQKLVSRQVQRSVSLKWLVNARLMQHMPILRALTPDSIGLGSKTVREWVVTGVDRGTLRELTVNGRLVPKANGTHYLNSTTRVTIDTKPRLRPGPAGFAGATAWAAWIDGFIQLYADRDLCLSNMQRANRFALSLTLGLAGGVAAGLAFAAAVALTAGAPFIVAASVPILVGLAVGYGAGIVSNRLKDIWFNNNPKFFGAY